MASNEDPVGTYELSLLADADLENIYEYSFSEFGFTRAEEYLEGIHHLFQQLTLFPNEGILRNDININVRSIPYESHIVFYSGSKKSILIIRILHQSQNSSEYFK
ncbi:MAG: type II toxin-antitoxin system RelE/ParE family toxin [Aequorivita sp.]|nr:type II toxin-antitoxin system RelE/ParE family toxin [Aequorivita sp.]